MYLCENSAAAGTDPNTAEVFTNGQTSHACNYNSHLVLYVSWGGINFRREKTHRLSVWVFPVENDKNPRVLVQSPAKPQFTVYSWIYRHINWCNFIFYIFLNILARGFHVLWITVLMKALTTSVESDCVDLPAFYLLQGHDWSIHRPARTRCSPHWILSWEIPAKRRTVTIVWNVISSTSERRLSLSFCVAAAAVVDTVVKPVKQMTECDVVKEVCVCGCRRRVGEAPHWLVLREGEEPCGSGPPEPLRCCGQCSETHLLCGR